MSMSMCTELKPRCVLVCVGYQLGDFTNALKSCISSGRKAYVHVSNDLYYTFMPRYPFVYINEYNQDIPSPSYHDDVRLDSLDAGILLVLFLISVVGFVLAMQKMNLLAFCTVQSGPRVVEYVDSNAHFYRDQEDVGRSFVPRTPMKSVSSLWSSMGWHRGALKKESKNLHGDEESNEQDEEAVELMGHHRSNS